ncbi:MAG TPA: hypothetical protein VJ885_17120 [Thermoanaerobaculia bacterium]|nr:hypothetical protein [Thermoanaerobaculia bacterium]
MRGGLSRLTVKRTLIEVTGGQVEANGILLANTEHMAELRGVQITATNSGVSYGIRHTEGTFGGVRLTSSTVTADHFGIITGVNGPIFIENSQVRATGVNSGTGVYAPYSTVTVDHSEVAGVTSTVNGFYVYIGATRLHGGAVAASVTATCALVYDESFAPIVGPVCP